jgi:hypothetical protein
MQGGSTMCGLRHGELQRGAMLVEAWQSGSRGTPLLPQLTPMETMPVEHHRLEHSSMATWAVAGAEC